MKLHGLKKKLALSTAAAMFAGAALVAGGVAVPDAGAEADPKGQVPSEEQPIRPVIRAYLTGNPGTSS